jgi:hypothetical protein
MKKLLIAIAAVLVTAASYAQGTVNWSTRVTGAGGVDAPVFLGQAGGPGPGPAYSAELVVFGAGGSITPVPGTVVAFRTPTATAPALAQYTVVGGSVQVPGSPQGSSVNLGFRAWRTSDGSYDAAPAEFRGISAPVSVTLAGGIATPPNLTGLQGFIIPVPEPSTIALGVLGAAALLLRRRK